MFSLQYILEIILCQAAFLIFFQLYLSHSATFKTIRYYLLGSFLASFFIPLISIDLYITDPIYGVKLDELVVGNTASEDSSTTSISNVLGWIYFIGTSAFLIRFAHASIRLWRLISLSEKHTYTNYTLVKTAGAVPTSSFFHYLLLNDSVENLNEQEQRMIIKHELTHIRENHSLDILVISVCQIFFWFNPMIYWYAWAIRQNHEYLADQHSADGQRKIYARLLLNEALAYPKLSLTSYFGASSTLKRIMQLATTRKNSWHQFLAIALCGIFITVLFACQKETPQEEVARLAGKDISEPKAESTGKDEPLTIVDQLPEFKGGMEAFFKHVGSQVLYPETAKKEGVEGKVIVEFVVDKNGKVINVKAKNSLGYGLDEAAVAAVQSSPRWKPGRHQGEKVAVKLVLPVTFALDN